MVSCCGWAAKEEEAATKLRHKATGRNKAERRFMMLLAMVIVVLRVIRRDSVSRRVLVHERKNKEVL
jgi:hypothetical protein